LRSAVDVSPKGTVVKSEEGFARRAEAIGFINESPLRAPACDSDVVVTGE